MWAGNVSIVENLIGTTVEPSRMYCNGDQSTHFIDMSETLCQMMNFATVSACCVSPQYYQSNIVAAFLSLYRKLHTNTLPWSAGIKVKAGSWRETTDRLTLICSSWQSGCFCLLFINSINRRANNWLLQILYVSASVCMYTICTWTATFPQNL